MAVKQWAKKKATSGARGGAKPRKLALERAASLLLKRPSGSANLRYSSSTVAKAFARVQAIARKKLGEIVQALGHNATADILQVDRSQLSRILKGSENASAELQRHSTEFEYVLARLTQVMYPDEIAVWFTSPEPLLNNAIPINVLRLHGPERVVRAINGIEAGVYS